ncbi:MULTISPECIES: methyltransferase domain-containing protein [unclassified Solwaraspora]|uniref:class I SAM-dependent methyltransferase n=1 Tax=unclassified Solwaraspora TaxID=2627926 RepID=UPI00248C9231|nr:MULTISPECIES: methyltransferase domain-containing protein [unclassified Solwaraspora]WBB96739.1 methyltransferase domain-containing protein [Solwaraspora sp. WMMA2059]WBC19357.1 methyltransferase domain-containing protein [Solwaraspora sp. WMMA2080]WJK33200.1 methyltransferase domain-containing protein [Solwaraspora sp. WMMA2065]
MSAPGRPPLSPRAALRWDIVRRQIAALQPTNILELGCGLGAVGTYLAGAAPYTAVEPDDQSFAVAHQRITPHGGTVIHGDHRKAPAGTTYDLVCAFEVLEHIEDDAAALAAWLPLVRPGRQLLLSVPADPHRFGPSDVLAGHYRRYTADQLHEVLTAAGAEQIRIIHYAWPLGYILDIVRDRLAARRTATAAESAQDRTHTSGRLFQPRGALAGTLIRAAVAPFAAVQRLRPGHGPGLVAVATRPAVSA